jgi:hypothetical protein
VTTGRRSSRMGAGVIWPTAESTLIGLGGANQNFMQCFQKYDQQAGHAIHRGRETRLAHRKASA